MARGASTTSSPTSARTRQAILSFPSTALAWRLYGDPARAEDLVARNRVATPLFMATNFEALAP